MRSPMKPDFRFQVTGQSLKTPNLHGLTDKTITRDVGLSNMANTKMIHGNKIQRLKYTRPCTKQTIAGHFKTQIPFDISMMSYIVIISHKIISIYIYKNEHKLSNMYTKLERKKKTAITNETES